jgi:HSP20 family protein
MAIVKWEPFGGLFRFRTFMPDLQDLLPQVSMWPNMDVYSEGDDLIVDLEVPDLRPEDINITLNDGYVMVTGHRERERHEEGKEYFRRERYVGSFTREIPLPKEVKEQDIKANMKDGLLEIRIKGAGREVPAAKRIPIEGSAEEATSGETGEGRERSESHMRESMAGSSEGSYEHVETGSAAENIKVGSGQPKGE